MERVIKHTGKAGQRRRVSRFRLFFSHSPFHHLVLEQTAFDSAIVEWGPLGCGQADELGQLHIGAEQVGAPAAELSLQYVAEFGLKFRQCLLLAKTHAVRRVSDDNAFVRRRQDLKDVGPFETDDFL